VARRGLAWQDKARILQTKGNPMTTIPTSPRIPIPANCRLTSCTPALELRVRTMLVWHAGDCGLIRHDVMVAIGLMHLDELLTLDDLRKLTTPAVYAAIVEWITEEVDRRARVGRLVAEAARTTG